ncbi:LADA_0G09208g1_1 [Lachancea dasiensis]|uniref:LADA_0G09208g1_1 n=1 Tax=Lachancea dasiensis TaxID=1072105 RepID=A0A1G4JUI5_9SACH|nr:LADA_0G09208g1_1 [Lachancea dasiensis]
MSYYNRYRNQRSYTPQADSAAAVDEPDAIFELGKNKRVTVRQFRNMNLIDIREYYADSSSGEMKPGKKGISLTEEVYDELLKHRQNIDDALRRFGSKRPRTKTVNVLSDSEETTVDIHTPNKASFEKSDSKTRNTEKPRKERKKREPAPPQAQPDEKRRRHDELESQTRLVIPGGDPQPSALPDKSVGKTAKAKKKSTEIKTGNNGGKKNNKNNNPRLDDMSSTVHAANPRLDDHLHKLTSPTKPENDSGLDSSDEDFALALESEFNKDDDDDDESILHTAEPEQTDGNISEES